MWAVHHDLIDSIFIIQSKEECDQITSEMVDLGESNGFGQFLKFWHIHPNENLFHQSTLGTACFAVPSMTFWFPRSFFFASVNMPCPPSQLLPQVRVSVTFTRGQAAEGLFDSGEVWRDIFGSQTMDFWPLLFKKVDFLEPSFQQPK